MSATVTEIRRHEQGGRRQRDADERAASLAKIEADAKAHRDQRTLIPEGERIMVAARATLRREGLPCMFIPADPAVSERINEAVAKVSGAGFVANLRDLVGTDSSRDWSDASAALDALVDVLRPYASEPLQYVGNAGLAVQAAAAMGKHDVADAKRVAAEVKRLMTAIKRAEKKAAGPRRAAAKPKAAPIVAPQPEPTEEESVTMTDETGAPPATPLDAAVLAHRGLPGTAGERLETHLRRGPRRPSLHRRRPAGDA
jgi:hypothetical protein